MGDIEYKDIILEAKANIKDTWQDLLGKAKIYGPERDKPILSKVVRENDS